MRTKLCPFDSRSFESPNRGGPHQGRARLTMGHGLSCMDKRGGCIHIVRPTIKQINVEAWSDEPSTYKVLSAPTPPPPPPVAGMSIIETLRWRDQHLDLTHSPCRPSTAKPLNVPYEDDILCAERIRGCHDACREGARSPRRSQVPKSGDAVGSHLGRSGRARPIG